MIVHMDSEREARLLGSRVIFVKSIWAYWGDAETYDELHDLMRGRSQLWVRPFSLSTPITQTRRM
jgi:tRNA (guanine10-N2)-methyltransferase